MHAETISRIKNTIGERYIVGGVMANLASKEQIERGESCRARIQDRLAILGYIPQNKSGTDPMKVFYHYRHVTTGDKIILEVDLGWASRTERKAIGVNVYKDIRSPCGMTMGEYLDAIGRLPEDQ